MSVRVFTYTFLFIFIVSNYAFADKLDGKWEAFAGADISESNPPCSTSKKAAKMHYPDNQGNIKFFPKIKDWSKYKQLRLKIFNTNPTRSLFLVLRIEDDKGIHSFGPSARISHGYTFAIPSKETVIPIKLENFPKKLDRKKIKSLIFYYWGKIDATFYMNDIALLTEQEVKADAVKQKKEILTNLDKELERFQKSSFNEKFMKKLAGYRHEIKTLLSKPEDIVSSKSDEIILNSKRLITVLEVLLKNKSKLAADNPKALVFANPPTKKVFLDEPYSGTPDYNIQAAGHEHESFQTVVVPVSPLNKLEVSASPLKMGNDPQQVISNENIKINPVGYLEVLYSFCYSTSRPGWWPDPLMKNQALKLENRIQPYWITVYVPSGQKPGIYQGTLNFKENGKVFRRFNYTLRVHNFSLPIRGKLKTFMTFSVRPEDKKQRRRYYETVLDYRISPISMYASGPKTQPDESDLQFCLERGLNSICLAYLYNKRNKDPFKFDKKDFEEIANEISSCLKTLDKFKCRDMAFVNTSDELLFCDTESKKYRMEELKKKCSFMKEKFPDLKLCAVGHRLPISRKLMDIWYLAPTVDTLPIKSLKELHDEKAEVNFYWVYENPSFMLDLPGIAPRICSWIAFKYDAKAIGYYSTYRPWALNCPDANAPTGIFWSKERINAYTYANRYGRVMDGNLFYPAPDKSLRPSIRLANIRDGIEDYEYLAILKELSPNGKDKLLNIPDSITTRTDNEYTKNYSELANYRSKIADQIEQNLKK